MDKRNSGGTLDGSSTDFDSTSLGLDLGSDSDAEERSGRAVQAPAAPAPAAPAIAPRDNAAKHKFYMEAPKPLQINPFSFFAKSNLAKLRFQELPDQSEAIEEMSEPEQRTLTPTEVERPSAGRLSTHADASPVIGEPAAKVTVTDYFAERWEACCEAEEEEEQPAQQLSVVVQEEGPRAEGVLLLEDAAQLAGETETDAPDADAPSPVLDSHVANGLAALDLPLAPLTFADLSDIHDIDSSSVPTENSCASDLSFSLPDADAPAKGASGPAKVPPGRPEEEVATSTPDTTIPNDRVFALSPLSPTATARLDKS